MLTLRSISRGASCAWTRRPASSAPRKIAAGWASALASASTKLVGTVGATTPVQEQAQQLLRRIGREQRVLLVIDAYPQLAVLTVHRRELLDRRHREGPQHVGHPGQEAPRLLQVGRHAQAVYQLLAAWATAPSSAWR